MAGAAAALSSATEWAQGTNLTSGEVRDHLISSGTPQNTTTPGALAGHIGPLPDLRAALVTAGLAPANNNFDTAQTVDGRSVALTGHNFGATEEAFEPDHAGDTGGASVWYRWTPSATGTVVIDTVGSTFDTLLGVYTGSALDGLTEVASNDQCCGGHTSSVSFVARAGTTYRIAVDGYAFGGDVSADVGNIVLNLAQQVPLVVVQETGTGVLLNSWHGVANASAAGGTHRVSDRAGATAAFRFTGTSVTWVTARSPAAGRARVLIDGVDKGVFDLYSPSVQWNVRHRFGGLANRSHVIEVKALGTKAAQSTGTDVAVDGFVTGILFIQDNTTRVAYGPWAGTRNSNADRGGYRSSDVAGSTVAFTFNGVGLDWIAAKGPGYGKAEVTLDGRSATRTVVDLYRTTQQWNTIGRSFTGLRAGTHFVVVKVLDQKRPASSGTAVVLDAFRVHP